MDPRDIDGLTEFERRKYGGESSGKHGFPRTGRTDHDEVVSPRRRDLEGPLGDILTPDVREIGLRRGPGPPVV